MKINFNNVRRNACRAHDRLVRKLNSATRDGEVRISVDNLEDVMNDLRMAVGAIASTYEEGNEDFKDVFEEMYPEPGHMEFFNPEQDEI